MKMYRVGFYYREGGSIEIPAHSPEQAKELIHDRLEQHGVDGLDDFDNYDTSHRDYSVDDVEEVKKR
ncbi:MAG: hypothetical protein ACW99G_22390 [Candidatus Thorarchaeota archaeon]|jgi:hypothetical protein